MVRGAAIVVSSFAMLIWPGCAVPEASGGGAPTQPAAKAETPTAPAQTPARGRSLRAEDFKALPFRSIGPATMGGRVADIHFAPSDTKTFYVGTATGGLWKTTNRGVTFSPVFDKESTSSIGSVVIADAPPTWAGWKNEPAEPDAKPDPEAEKNKGKGKIVWVGTGEGNGRNSSSYGDGVFRSTDSGSTFIRLGLEDSHDIPALAVDPRDPDVCYAAALGHLWGPNAMRGVFKTTDGGKTWDHVLKVDENTGCVDVILCPDAADTVYAAMYSRRRTAFSYTSGSETGGIFRSTDAGKTWTKLSNGLPKRTGRIGLDVYRKNNKILYAVIESDEGGWGVEPFDDRSKSGGVFRSEDGGDTWARVNDRSPRAFYFSKVRIDPTDDQRIYRLGWGLDVSDDGGKTFRAGGAKRPHGDMHALTIDPTDRDHMVMGTDGGVYITFDRGATWDFLNSMPLGQFYNVAVDMSEPYRIGGGLQDNGSWIGPSATKYAGFYNVAEGTPAPSISNQDWKLIAPFGDGFHVAFDPKDANIVYAESQGGFLTRNHLDSGRTKMLRPSAKEGGQRYRWNWNTPFLVSHHDSTVIYMGGNRVFRLTQRGEAWEEISGDLTTNVGEKFDRVGSSAEQHCTVVSLAESTVARGTLWAGSDDGLVHVTADDGKTWKNVTPPGTDGKYIECIEAGRADARTAYVVIDGHRSNDFDPHVVVTTDLGATWTDITADLPKGAHAKVVREEMRNPDVLFVGTERGMFVSIDRGRGWVRMNGEGLPTVLVDDIVQHPRETDLVIGTHGRSIYVVDDASFFAQLPAALGSQMHLFDIRPAAPKRTMANEGFWGEGEFTAANPPMGAKITYFVRDFVDEDISIAITDAKGTMVRKLSGPNRPGVTRVVWDLQPEASEKMPMPADDPQPQFVPAGDYTVTITQGKDVKMSKRVTVRAE